MFRTMRTATERPKTTPIIGKPMSNVESKAMIIPVRIAGNIAAKRAFLTLPALAPPTKPAINGPIVGKKIPRIIDRTSIHPNAATTEPSRG